MSNERILYILCDWKDRECQVKLDEGIYCTSETIE